MDEISLMIDTIINHELDDLILDLVYDIHSSIKGIPEDQLDLINNGAVRTSKQLNNTFLSFQTTPIDKQTCRCPHCGQSNIIAIRFAYHLAKCLGVGRRSSRQAKHQIIDQIISDDSRSNGDDAGSYTDSTSSSSNPHRQIDHEYIEDFDDEDEDDWKPTKKKRKNAIWTNLPKKKKKKILIAQPMPDLDFDNCIIPLDKLCPQTPHVNGEMIYLPKSCSIRSPLNLVEDEQSSTTSIIMFQDDDQQ